MNIIPKQTSAWVFHKDGHYIAEDRNYKPLGRYTKMTLWRTNLLCELIHWNRHYHMQNGRKAAIIDKVWVWNAGRYEEYIPNKWLFGAINWVLNKLSKNILRKKRLWFDL